MSPSVGGCVRVWERVPQCRRVGWMCVSVYVCVSLPSVLMGDVGEECVQVYMRMSVIVTCTYLCINM